MTKQKNPKIRFTEFTDAWEQRKLGEVADFSKGNGYSKADLIDEGQPIILYGRLYTNYETVIRNVETFARKKANSVFSQGGEVIVPASGESAEDISRASVVEKSEVMLGGDLNIITVNEKINPTFLALTISNGTQQKELSKRAQGKSVVHLRNTDLEKVDLLFPSNSEQKKIGDFFSNIDNLIALHQRKLEELKSFKSTMLSKMFPKHGQTVPEIRLAGFDGEWETKRLIEVADINPKGVVPEKFNYVDLESVTGTRLISYRTENKESAPSRAQRLAQFGDIFYQTVRPYQKNNYLFQKEEGNWVFSTGYAQIRAKINNEFLFIWLQRTDFVNKVLLNCTGTSYPAVNSKDLSRLKISVPKMEEQQAIGEFFSNLDSLISSTQASIEEFKTLKKKLLQEMFVN